MLNVLRYITVASFLFGMSPVRASVCLTQSGGSDQNRDILNAAEAEVRREPGLYTNGEYRSFRIAKDGIDRGAIIGTYHLPNARTTFLPPDIYALFVNAERLVVETDISTVAVERMRNFRSAVSALMLNGGSVQATLAIDRASNGRLFEITSAMDIRVDQLSKISLLGIENMLAGRYCGDSIQTYNQGGHPLDMTLTAWARLLGKEVIEIEPLESYLYLIKDPNPPMSLSIIALMLKRDGSRSKLLDFQLSQYFSGRIDYVVGAERAYMANDEERDAMFHRSSSFVTIRNARFVEAIEQSLNRPGQVFVAVGAEHLIGANGVIALLLQSGWSITPLTY